MEVNAYLIILVFNILFLKDCLTDGRDIQSINKNELSNKNNMNENSNSPQNPEFNSSNELTLLPSSSELSNYNVLKLNVQDYCNQLWSFKSQLEHTISSIVKSHREFILFLNKHNVKLSSDDFEELFNISLNYSINNSHLNEIKRKFNEYNEIAIDYKFVFENKENSRKKILVSHSSPLHQYLKDFYSLFDEYSKYALNIEKCMNNKKKIIKNGSSAVRTLTYLVEIFNETSNSGDENLNYLKKIASSKATDTNIDLFKTLRKLQVICNQGISQDNPLRKKQTYWLKKKSKKIAKKLEGFDSVFKMNLNKIKNLTNCISHFQNSYSIDDKALSVVEKIGTVVINHSINRRNILSVINSKYTFNTLSTFILDNKLFSLWLFVQKRITTIQIAIKIIKQSNELSNRVNKVIQIDKTVESIAKCSELLRNTASDWNIFLQENNSEIIKNINKESLEQLNRYKSEDDRSLSSIKHEWNWLNTNIENIIDKGYNAFISLIDNFKKPLTNCAKTLSPIYKSLKSELNPKLGLDEKIRKKVAKNYKSILNEVSNYLSKQTDSLSSLKYLFLWPHNNATLVSAISMYNRTYEFMKSIGVSYEQAEFQISNYSLDFMEQQLQITEGFSNLYGHVQTRLDWDQRLFKHEFGYTEDLNVGVETQDTIYIPKLKIIRDSPICSGEWFDHTLEFLCLNVNGYSLIKNIIEPATQLRIQFFQQWLDIVSKLIFKVGNPIALSVNKVSEEAYRYYLQEQISKSRELTNYFENNISIMRYVDVVDDHLSSLNKESFISKFETTNSPNPDESLRSEDEFPSFASIKNYLLNLKKRVDNFCGDSNKFPNDSPNIKILCDNISTAFSRINQNSREYESKIQKIYSDLESQEVDIRKLDSIIQHCISMDNKIDRVKCWVPSQSLELPLRRALQIRKVMNGWLRNIIKSKILLLSNFIEGCLRTNLEGSLIFNSTTKKNNEDFDQEKFTKSNEVFNVMLKLLEDIIPNVIDDLNMLESIYLKYYQNKMEEVDSASKELIFNYVKLNSMKTTLIQNYGRPNLFQKIFKFPKLLLPENEVRTLEHLIHTYENLVNNNSTFAADVNDYIKNNAISANNHTIVLGKFLRTLSTFKTKIEEILRLRSEGSTSKNENLLTEIELEKNKHLEENGLIILGESDKYLKLANIENFRYYTIRNITGNIVETISGLSEEIRLKEEELERKEEEIANTNCFRRWKWKRRIKRRNKNIKNKKNKEKIKKRVKFERSQSEAKILKLKNEANGKLKLILTKTVNFDNLGSLNEATTLREESYLDRSELNDLETFQFDDLYKFDERPGRYNPKNRNEEIEYDLDTGGYTDDEKKVNSKISKISSILDMALTINNSIRQYREIKAALKESGVEFSSEDSGVNLMAGINILNAITGGPSNDFEAMFGSTSDQSGVFDDADILSELHAGETQIRAKREIGSQPRSEISDSSYYDFKQKVEFELRNSRLDFDFDD
ncbi:rhoptry protein [Cryptosporidium felis]|nr:rhoptry protein [Cryptosporidium felis]